MLIIFTQASNRSALLIFLYYYGKYFMLCAPQRKSIFQKSQDNLWEHICTMEFFMPVSSKHTHINKYISNFLNITPWYDISWFTTQHIILCFLVFFVDVVVVVGIIMIQIYLYIKKETFMYLHSEVLCSLFAICGKH